MIPGGGSAPPAPLRIAGRPVDHHLGWRHPGVRQPGWAAPSRPQTGHRTTRRSGAGVPGRDRRDRLTEVHPTQDDQLRLAAANRPYLAQIQPRRARHQESQPRGPLRCPPTRSSPTDDPDRAGLQRAVRRLHPASWDTRTAPITPGSTGNMSNDPNPMFEVVYADVLARTGGRLDLALVTHRHPGPSRRVLRLPAAVRQRLPDRSAVARPCHPPPWMPSCSPTPP